MMLLASVFESAHMRLRGRQARSYAGACASSGKPKPLT